jgi:large subunit ribosomal protein L3
MTIIAKKVGMQRVCDQEGRFSTVSVLSVLKSEVIGTKTIQKDGYDSLVKKVKFGKRCRIFESRDNDRSEYILKEGDIVDVESKTKGKGFAGVIKRHGFSRGPVSHGSDHHKKPGSIGSMYPQRVVRGKKMPGRMGGNNSTVKNLRVISVDDKNTFVVLSGSIPGPKGSLQKIRIVKKNG